MNKALYPLLFLLLISSDTFSQRVIHFSGLDWNVRSGSGGPGPNSWSDSNENVWVDSTGSLHLMIRKSGNTWYCSEVYLKKSYGYGKYVFHVTSDVETYDSTIVVGLFTYENDSREIDIEFARWTDNSNPAGWYTIQPPPYSFQNQQSFQLGLNGFSSIHYFNWQSASIEFRSTKPYTFIVPPNDSLINEWTYTGSNNPPTGNERLHINFWLFQGKPPAGISARELIISRVEVPGVSAIDENTFTVKRPVLSPVPCKDMLSVEFPAGSDYTAASIFSILGNQLLTMEINPDRKTEIDVSSLSSGIYIIRFSNSGNTVSGYFSVSR